MTNKKKSGLLAIMVFTLFLGVGAASAQSQASTGQITGVVTDSTGAVVPNANIKIVNKSTGAEKTTVTNSGGIYQFILLQPGTYTVSASGGGFAEQTLEATVNVGRTVDVNFSLGVGDVAAVVNVTGEEVQTTQSVPDAVLSDTAISNLPINGRRFQDLATLTPTAQIDPQRGQISISGQRGINTNINVDGADYNQPFFGGIRGGERSNSAFTLPQEAIREFNIVSAGYSAEFGRSSGGVINVVTKSGGNEVRGSAFYLIRPEEAARAHDYAQAIGDSLPAGIDATLAPTQHQFGGSIGGPIKTDRLFYFGSYEQQRVRAPRQVLYRNALDVNPANLNPGQLDVFNLYKSLEEPFTLTNDAYAGLARVDGNFGANNNLAVRFNYSKNNAKNAVTTGEFSVDPTTNRSLLTNGTEKDRTYSFVGQLVTSISSNVINELRAQYTREDRPRLANAEVALVSSTYGDIGTRSFMPTTQFDTRIQIADSITVIAGGHTLKFGGDYNRIHADQLFGFNQFGNFNFFDNNDGVMLNVLSNVPNSNAQFGRFDNMFATYRQQIGNLEAAYTVQEISAFAQDSWRVTPRLTLNYGLRVEQQYNPEPALGNDALISLVQNASFPIRNGRGFDPTQIVDSGWQWGPRAGFAWDPVGDGKTVVRGFAGLYYARTPMLLLAGPYNNFRGTPGDLSVQFPFSIPSTFSQSMFDAANPQYVAIVGTGVFPNTVYRHFAIAGVDLNQSTLTNMPNLTTAQLEAINNAILAASPGAPMSTLGFFSGAQPIGFDENYKNPRSLQFGVGFEREFAKNLSVGFDYSHINTVYLQRNKDINLPSPILLSASLDPARRPYFGVFRGRGLPSSVPIRPRPVPELGSLQIRESSGRSLYRAFTARLRYNRSWVQLNTYYVYSTSFSDDDNERSAGGTTYDNSFNLVPEYNYSDLDVRHRFTANPVFFLPYGFEISSTMRFRTGRPVNVNANSDLNGDGTSNDRPYLAPGVPFLRNAFRNRNEYEVDLRVQKGFDFDERKRLVLSAEFFNIFNLSNIQYSGSGTTRYCASSNDRTCGFTGPTNSNFLQVKNSSGDLITFANFAGTQVFQAQFGARFYF